MMTETVTSECVTIQKRVTKMGLCLLHIIVHRDRPSMNGGGDEENGADPPPDDVCITVAAPSTDDDYKLQVSNSGIAYQAEGSSL